MADTLRMLQARLAYLNGKQATAISIGDEDEAARLQVAIEDVQDAIADLSV
jgi:O-acetylhomoserine/O-acetylserine sulfhydrylase-like pyridoxal-dependent enzyme